MKNSRLFTWIQKNSHIVNVLPLYVYLNLSFKFMIKLLHVWRTNKHTLPDTNYIFSWKRWKFLQSVFYSSNIIHYHIIYTFLISIMRLKIKRIQENISWTWSYENFTAVHFNTKKNSHIANVIGLYVYINLSFKFVIKLSHARRTNKHTLPDTNYIFSWKRWKFH